MYTFNSNAFNFRSFYSGFIQKAITTKLSSLCSTVCSVNSCVCVYIVVDIIFRFRIYKNNYIRAILYTTIIKYVHLLFNFQLDSV